MAAPTAATASSAVPTVNPAAATSVAAKAAAPTATPTETTPDMLAFPSMGRGVSRRCSWRKVRPALPSRVLLLPRLVYAIEVPAADALALMLHGIVTPSFVGFTFAPFALAVRPLPF